jgi:polyribonucleotide nucleotidyltransferase
MKRHTVTEEMKKLLSVWLQKNFQELLKCHTQALNKDMMQLHSHRVGKVTEEQEAEQHKRFNIKYLTDNFSMAERALASFDSRTQVGTGLPALAAVPNVTASCKMIYGHHLQFLQEK